MLDEVYAQRVTLMPGAETLVATMRAHGAVLRAGLGRLSASSREKVAARLGFDTEQANRLDIADGKIAGTRRRADPRPRGQARRPAAAGATSAASTSADTMAVGDGANDLGMIGAAGLGVAFRAKPVVAAAAAASIAHGDLTALLYLQGYRRDEFVT